MRSSIREGVQASGKDEHSSCFAGDSNQRYGEEPSSIPLGFTRTLQFQMITRARLALNAFRRPLAGQLEEQSYLEHTPVNGSDFGGQIRPPRDRQRLPFGVYSTDR